MTEIVQNEELEGVTGTVIDENGFDGLVGETLIDHPWGKAALDKAREPLAHNIHPHLDFVSRIAYSELAWFFDPLRHEQLPEYGPETIAKMRQPVMGNGHFRVGPATLHFLFDLAWS